jgi:hypothetical protein
MSYCIQAYIVENSDYSKDIPIIGFMNDKEIWAIHPFHNILVSTEGRVYVVSFEGYILPDFGHSRYRGPKKVNVRDFDISVRDLVLETFYGPKPFQEMKSFSMQQNHVLSSNNITNLSWVGKRVDRDLFEQTELFKEWKTAFKNVNKDSHDTFLSIYKHFNCRDIYSRK